MCEAFNGMKSEVFVKKFFLALLLACPLTAYSEVSTEIYCFQSLGGNSIKFEFRSYYDSVAKWSGASVKYSKSKEAITLAYRGSEEEVMDPDRPSQFTTTWVEVSNGVVTGYYEMVSQGARIYGMTYTNYKTKAVYSFQYDMNMDPSPEMGCQW